ncbi:MAG: diacylglycerol kinase family protein [Erysipelotrichaceae bacterium]|nr:diacylglycerol kinase family protein [Erysipelotrichaceae bacterium]
MISFLKKYKRKFQYAFQGLLYGCLKDRSIRLHVGIALLVIGVCAYLSLSMMEWCFIIGSIFIVLAFEFVNSAIEGIVDFISPNYHKEAKKIKDYAAAAVLLISFLAAMIGIYIIGGKLW